MTNERALHLVVRESFHVGHVAPNEFNGVLHDRGEVRVVSYGLVL